AILARELSKNPEVFKYTSTRERDFRGGEFIMRTHNKLLASVDGCDGFKTGYFKAAGFSIVATAKRNGVRIIAVVLGSIDRKVRDTKTSELLAIGFAKTPPRPEATQPVVPQTASPAQPQTSPASPAEPQGSAAEEKQGAGSSLGRDLLMIGVGFGGGVLACVLVSMLRSRPRSRKRRLM
ncbi:MAG: D-alanyl-D-alanine carboxypeptidase, partial [Desulfofustis sp.]|nr:D-alanyl-D-alanine carboxypeptidase [Desulfofustis sp.]